MKNTIISSTVTDAMEKERSELAEISRTITLKRKGMIENNTLDIVLRNEKPVKDYPKLSKKYKFGKYVY